MKTSLFDTKNIFEKGSGFRLFLLSVLITGISYGIYKGMFDNFLLDVVQIEETGKGVTEFFRELPGILLIFILAAFYMLSAESLYKAGAIIMLVGMLMHAAIPQTPVLATLALCTYSVGEHIQIGMKSTLSLKYAKPGNGGAALGAQTSMNQIGTLIGFAVIIVAFALFPDEGTYNIFFYVAAALAAVSVLLSMGIKGKSETDKNKRRLYFHKKYTKYYMLEMFYGARKQVFLTFGPFVLVKQYGANASTMGLLFAISAIACFICSPLIGKIIDKLGYKVVMVSDTIILVVVCFFYGFAHHLFPEATMPNVAFIVCCVNYVLDAVISLASMASNLYVKDLSDNDDEVKATISTGVSINHVITIFIALFGGWIWSACGIEWLFVISAILGLCNSAYAATVNAQKDKLKV